jgi:hypothetical protein
MVLQVCKAVILMMLKKKRLYKQFNEKHDLKIPMTFDIGDQFADTYSFKRALKTYVV